MSPSHPYPSSRQLVQSLNPGDWLMTLKLICLHDLLVAEFFAAMVVGGYTHQSYQQILKKVTG